VYGYSIVVIGLWSERRIHKLDAADRARARGLHVRSLTPSVAGASGEVRRLPPANPGAAVSESSPVRILIGWLVLTVVHLP
jgi:hypothetical protein